MSRYYTTIEVAQMLKMDPQVVRQKCRQGHWPAFRPPGVRDWRIPIADFEEMLWNLEETARKKTAEGERVCSQLG